MKKLLLMATCALAVASCSNVDEDALTAKQSTNETAIGFETFKPNMTRTTNLEDELPNFGVWAYKTISGSANLVMSHYLVGWFDQDHLGAVKSYYSGAAADQWFYEGLGTSEYTNTTNNDYIKSDADDYDNYKSSHTNQYLKYWDNSATSYTFYAYTPYSYNMASAFNNTDKTITFPAATASTSPLSQYMVANKEVTKGSGYPTSVPLEFSHLTGKVNIAFYNAIEGYNVQLMNLTSTVGVAVKPTKVTASSTYEVGNITNSCANIKYDYSSGAVTYVTPAQGSGYINFTIPTGTISNNSATPTASETTYYCIPAQVSPANDGLRVRLSFQMTSTDGSKEVIKVYNATAFVPNTYTKWEKGKAYTYIFKITDKTTGSTEKPDPDPNPEDPNPSNPALSPIVFAGITVTDYTNGGYTNEFVVSE